MTYFNFFTNSLGIFSLFFALSANGLEQGGTPRPYYPKENGFCYLMKRTVEEEVEKEEVEEDGFTVLRDPKTTEIDNLTKKLLEKDDIIHEKLKQIQNSRKDVTDLISQLNKMQEKLDGSYMKNYELKKSIKELVEEKKYTEQENCDLNKEIEMLQEKKAKATEKIRILVKDQDGLYEQIDKSNKELQKITDEKNNEIEELHSTVEKECLKINYLTDDSEIKLLIAQYLKLKNTIIITDTQRTELQRLQDKLELEKIFHERFYLTNEDLWRLSEDKYGAREIDLDIKGEMDSLNFKNLENDLFLVKGQYYLNPNHLKVTDKTREEFEKLDKDKSPSIGGTNLFLDPKQIKILIEMMERKMKENISDDGK